MAGEPKNTKGYKQFSSKMYTFLLLYLAEMQNVVVK